jgi:ribosome-associated protein
LKQERVALGVAAALDKKAADLVVLKIADISGFADYFVICHGSSDRQVRAISDEIQERLRESGHRPISIEGETKANWILVDYGDVVFHVFLEERRRYYGLERLWGDAPDETPRYVSGRKD